jgi:hypothetical protein
MKNRRWNWVNLGLFLLNIATEGEFSNIIVGWDVLDAVHLIASLLGSN